MIDDSPRKQCKTCEKWFPATLQYFHKGPGCTDGLRIHCKDCANAQHRDKRRTNPPQRSPEAYKRCSSCGIEKANTDENFSVHRSQCRECIQKYQKEYNATHKEQHREWARNHPASDKTARRRSQHNYVVRHKEKILERRRIIYRENKERYQQYQTTYRLRHPEQFRATQGQSRLKYHSRVNALRRNYYARKRHAQGAHTAQDIQAQYERQKGKCYYCHKKLTKYHVDHVIPLSRGGSNGPDNLVIACPTCNDSKGSKMPHEFFKGNRLL